MEDSTRFGLAFKWNDQNDFMEGKRCMSLSAVPITGNEQYVRKLLSEPNKEDVGWYEGEVPDPRKQYRLS